MNREKVMSLVHKEIDNNSKLASDSIKEHDFISSEKYIYANKILISLGISINKIIWK